MYKITKDGANLGMIEAPTYIKRAPNGCLVLCPENEATGIAWEGKVYGLLGREELPGVPAIMLEQVDGGGKLYKCLQVHTSQEGWTPDAAPSLWVAISDPAEEWPAWSQPIGAQDAYPLGAKVSHGEKHWLSAVDNNVWEPGVYGWEEAADV